jgi:hypothetical protein
MMERGIDKARRELAEKKASGKHDEFLKHMERVMEMATKLKAAMVKRGLTRAKAKCQICDGYLQGTLAGRKQHLHMHCDGPCKAVMME